MKEITTQERIRVLNEEINLIKSQYTEHATGHLRTAVSVLERRVDDLTNEFNEEQRQRNK